MNDTPLLNTPLIRRRRLQLAMSERELAKRLAVTGAVVNSLERGTNHADLPVSVLCTLAKALALTPDELLTQPAPAPGDQPEQEPSDLDEPTGVPSPTRPAVADAPALGALLHDQNRLVPLEALADALGWSAARVATALAELAAGLPAVGLRLHRLGDDVGLMPAASAAEPAVVERLARRVLARRSLSLLQARLLYQAHRETLPPTAGGNADRVALGCSLINAGLIENAAGPRGQLPTLTADVRVSLLLDDAPADLAAALLALHQLQPGSPHRKVMRGVRPAHAPSPTADPGRPPKPPAPAPT